MKFARLLTATATLALGASAAIAADLPHRDAPILPPATPVYAPTWTGFYLGGNVGGAFMDKSPLAFYGEAGDRLNIQGLDRDASSVTFGGGIGYNLQLGSFVGGVEADYNYLRLRATNGYASVTNYYGLVTESALGQFRQNVDSFGTARGRLGFLVTPQFLLYGTGGLAFGDMTLSGTARADYTWNATGERLGTVGPYAFKRSDFKLGYTAGGGVEYALNPNWSVKAEGLYVNLDSQTAYVRTEEFGTVRVSTRDRDFVVGRVGVNYKW